MNIRAGAAAGGGGQGAERPSAGCAALEQAARDGAEVVVFSELAFERFHPQRPAGPEPWRLAEPVPGPTTDRFAAAARELGVVVVLNLYERDGRAGVRQLAGDRRGRHAARAHPDGPHHRLPVLPRAGLLRPRRHRRAGLSDPGRAPSAWRSATTGTIPSTCARSRSAARTWSSSRRPARWTNGRRASTRREVRVAAFQHGYFVALCNRVGVEECLTFGGESFVCAPDGRVVARAGRLTTEVLHADLDLAEARDSHARRLFLRDRRPELYPAWLGRADRIDASRGTLSR